MGTKLVARFAKSIINSSLFLCQDIDCFLSLHLHAYTSLCTITYSSTFVILNHLLSNLIAFTPPLPLSIFHHHTRPGALMSLLNSPISTIFFLGVPFPTAMLLALPLLCRICSKASSLLIPPGVAGAGEKGTSSLRGIVIVLV